MEVFDAHTHVQFPAYDADRNEVMRRANAAGVRMLAVGTNAATSEAALRLAEQYPEDVWAAVGFHPSHLDPQWHHDKNEQAAPEPERFDIQTLRRCAARPKAVAIGECGLDYYRITHNELKMKEKQREVFLQQAAIAEELKKPLMIHCRPSKGADDAYEDLVSLISNSRFLIPTIVHFYVGSLAVTKKLLAAGFYFTFGGVITFSRDYDESIRMVPLARILLETDAPYVAPEPYRGKRNEPAYVVEVAKKLAEIKKTSLEAVARETAKTAAHLFGINLPLL